MKIIHQVFLLPCTLILLFLFSSCSSSTIHQNNKKENDFTSNVQTSKKIRIGLSLSGHMEDRWIKDKQAMESACKKNGIEIFTESGDQSADRQEAQCQGLIAKGIDLLILVPYDAEKSASIVSYAHSKGVKVISYDRLVLNADVDLYITFDNEKVGEMQAKAITAAAPKGNYIFLEGAPSDNNSKYFTAGAQNYLKPFIDNGSIKIVLQKPVIDWNPDNAYAIVADYLKINKDIQGIIAPNDATAGGCIKALEESGLAEKISVTGQDAEYTAAKRILKGTQLMTIFKDTRKLGVKAIEVALSMLKGDAIKTNLMLNNNKIDVPTLYLDPVAVDKNNLDKELVQSGYLNKESIYVEN